MANEPPFISPEEVQGTEPTDDIEAGIAALRALQRVAEERGLALGPPRLVRPIRRPGDPGWKRTRLNGALRKRGEHDAE